jgi:DNA-binding response OmpR family regulator
LTPKRVLVVEDNEKTASSLRLYLESAGFVVELVRDGLGALAAFARTPAPPDLVLLDVMLPGLDGFDVCRRLRALSSVPVILLTARTTESDKLTGLGLGADDYVTKPFSPREVVARVKTVLRRAGGGNETAPARGAVVRAGELLLDPERHVADVGGRTLPLARSEFRVLEVLARRSGRVFSRDELALLAFGPDWDGSGRAIDAQVARLRRKLARAGAGVAIVTVFGVGYRLEMGRAP